MSYVKADENSVGSRVSCLVVKRCGEDKPHMIRDVVGHAQKVVEFMSINDLGTITSSINCATM